MAFRHFVTLRHRAMLSCLIPIALGVLLIFGSWLDPESSIFVGICLILGTVIISTGVFGIIGVAAKASTGIEIVQPLLLVENTVSILIGCLLFFELFFVKRYRPASNTTTVSDEEEDETTTSTTLPSLAHPENIRMLGFLSPKGTPAEQYVLEHRWIGYTAAMLFIILGSMGFLTTEILGAYKLELDVDQLVRERGKHWRETDEHEEKVPLKGEQQPGPSTAIEDREQIADIEEIQ